MRDGSFVEIRGDVVPDDRRTTQRSDRNADGCGLAARQRKVLRLEVLTPAHRLRLISVHHERGTTSRRQPNPLWSRWLESMRPSKGQTTMGKITKARLAPADDPIFREGWHVNVLPAKPLTEEDVTYIPSDEEMEAIKRQVDAEAAEAAERDEEEPS